MSQKGAVIAHQMLAGPGFKVSSHQTLKKLGIIPPPSEDSVAPWRIIVSGRPLQCSIAGRALNNVPKGHRDRTPDAGGTWH